MNLEFFQIISVCETKDTDKISGPLPVGYIEPDCFKEGIKQDEIYGEQADEHTL